MSSRPDEARNTAYRCLLEVLENQGYSNLVLKQELAGSALSEQDRSFVTAMVYGTITRMYTIDAVLAPYLRKELNKLDASVRTCLRMGAWQVLFAYGVKEYAAVSATVDLAREVCPSGAEDETNGFLPANAIAHVDYANIYVTGNEDRILVSAMFDNLGKGASGAAIECMNISMGIDPATGLVV